MKLVLETQSSRLGLWPSCHFACLAILQPGTLAFLVLVATLFEHNEYIVGSLGFAAAIKEGSVPTTAAAAPSAGPNRTLPEFWSQDLKEEGLLDLKH